MRTHRKIVVVDGRIGFAGGINITDEENEGLRPDAYRDLHLRMEGDIVRGLQLVFAEDWVYATGEREFLGELARTMPEPSTGSTAANGSSSNSMRGSTTSARASAVRWRWPPESESGN